MIELNRIYNMDCLEGMKGISDGSVDAVICDPPYKVLNKGNANAQWDRLLPFDRLWEQYHRVVKRNGAIVLFCQGMFTARLMMSNPDEWRYNLIWDKKRTTGFLNANRMPLRCHEDIAVFYREQPTYNPQFVDGEPSHARGSGVHKNWNQCYGEFSNAEFSEKYDRKKHPRSIVSVQKERNADVWHPTQKPVELIRWLVRTYTNEGDTVLDNCMGSGTTAIACLMENRKFVGFETNNEYWKKANVRIESFLNQPKQMELF